MDDRYAAPDPLFSSPILLVDDNEVNRIFLTRILASHGFTRLLAVASAEEALAALNEFRPDMVLLDIIMPGGMDGFACCAAIRAIPAYHDLPILMQTVITDPELRTRAFASGATDFVSKPIYPEELYARVRVHLQNRCTLQALQRYKNRVETELESARQLQRAILPNAAEIAEIARGCQLSIASCFQPSSEVGGDFWGTKSLFPHQTALWLVDFSGHGVAAALNAFRLQAYLKEHSLLMARPGEYLSHLNDKLLQLLLRGQFATMFYGIVDTQSNTLFYACACAPHPIILRGATGKAELLDGSGCPLGIGMHLYATQTTPFARGDMLLLYSDALTETPDAYGNYLDEATIIALLEQHAGASAEAMKTALLEALQRHGGDRLRDDLTLALCMR